MTLIFRLQTFPVANRSNIQSRRASPAIALETTTVSISNRIGKRAIKIVPPAIPIIRAVTMTYWPLPMKHAQYVMGI